VGTVHAQSLAAKGVLGRVAQALRTQDDPYAVGLYSIAGNTKMLEGSEQPADILHPKHGVLRFEHRGEMGDDLGALTARESASVFAETHLASLRSALHRTEGLGDVLDNVSLTETFDDELELGQQLQQVARVVAARGTLGAERDAFFVNLGGFDTHNDAEEDLREKFAEMDAALSTFVAELQAQGAWEDVALLSVSDFGRTLASNGQGTDHAWGGNHFLMGGGLAGGQVFGQYPSALGDEAPLNVGRGRLIPTTSWEAVWHGLAQWLGVEPAHMAAVLPNAANFPAGDLLTSQKLFA